MPIALPPLDSTLGAAYVGMCYAYIGLNAVSRFLKAIFNWNRECRRGCVSDASNNVY